LQIGRKLAAAPYLMVWGLAVKPCPLFAKPCWVEAVFGACDNQTAVQTLLIGVNTSL
jgi:hypothetical protein